MDRLDVVKNFKYIGRPTFPLAIFTATIGVIFSFNVAWKFHSMEQAFIARQFRNDVEEQVQAIERQVQLDLETLYMFKVLFESSEVVTAAEFRQAAEESLDRHPDLVSIYWVPGTSGSLRELLPAHTHSRTGGNSPYLNFSADPDLLATLESCCALRTINARRLSDPSRDNDGSSLFLAGMAVFRGQPAPTAERRKEPVGFILATFRVDAVFRNALNQTVVKEINLTLREGLAGSPLLYRHQSGEPADRRPGLKYEATLLPFAGRHWYVSATPTSKYLADRSSIQPLVIFFAGVGLVALATGLFTVLLRHSRIAEGMVETRTRELNRLNEKLERLSRTDKLTEVANRRFFDEHFEREWKRGLRSEKPLALVMIDIDHFKLYNDFYGHIEGDKCLCAVARCLEKTLKRPGDLVARYGGEEFVCVLPETGCEGLSVAEELRSSLENLRIPNPVPKTGGFLTISAGFSCIIPSEGARSDDLIQAADKALYQAKKAGRNRVEMCLDSESADNLPDSCTSVRETII